MSRFKYLADDGNLKKLIKDFYSKALKNNVPASGTIGEILKNNSYGLRVIADFSIIIDSELAEKKRCFVDAIIKKLKSKSKFKGNENDIENIAWRQFEKFENPSPSDLGTEFLIDLRKNLGKTYEQLVPNFIVYFGHNVNEIILGPVKVAKVNNFLEALNKKINPKDWNFQISDKLGFNGENKTIGVSENIWNVKLNASHSDVKDESIWLINVALSLLRLTFPDNKKNFPFPPNGETENSPFLLDDGKEKCVTLVDNNLHFGGMKVVPYYLVDDVVEKHISNEEIQKLYSDVLCAKPNTLGERVAYGLGWMSRGRQSRDCCERFLFFFTAIEALLSPNRGEPITKTISQYASFILSSVPEERYKIAQIITKLYNTRSVIIHSGERDASHSNAKQIQIISESLFKKVIENSKLTISSDEFNLSLNKAVYGASWPS